MTLGLLQAAVALGLVTNLLQAPARPAGPDSVTRRALALAYLRLERAVRDRPLAADRLAATNQTFDQATLAFLGGRYQQVIATLDSLGTVIEADPAAGVVSATAGATLPRTLVVGASVDPHVPPARLKIAVDQARAIGWNVEYREFPNQGHTLMVGSFLDQAVTWLLSPIP